MVEERRDITGLNCIEGASGKVVVDDRGIGDSWKECMGILVSEESGWDHGLSAEVGEDCVGMDGVGAALGEMGGRGAPGLSRLVTGMMRATGAQWMLDLCSCIMRVGGVPEGWRSGVVLPVCMGEGDPVECGSCRRIRLLEHAMKVVRGV